MTERAGPPNERGIALLAVLIVLIVALAAAALVSTRTHQEHNAAMRQEFGIRATYAAESGVAWAEDLLYNRWAAESAYRPRTDTMGDFARRLDAGLLVPPRFGGGKLHLPDGESVVLPVPTPLPRTSGRAGPVTIVRRDLDAATIHFDISAEGEDAFGNVRTAAATLQVAGRSYPYGDFALLTNTLTCIACHARVDAVDRIYDSSTERNDVPPVKVGVLETASIRTAQADTVIAGTIYARDTITDSAGQTLTDSAWLAADMKSVRVDPERGSIVETAYGHALPRDLTPAKRDRHTGLPPGGEALYLEYPADPGAQLAVDGVLPTAFYPVFNDLNGDRAVDRREMLETAHRFTGEWTGGVIYHVQSNATYGLPGLPRTGNMKRLGDALAPRGDFTDGHVVLVGTADHPILMQGAIGVFGDVVISGVVRGEGALYASGNIYVVGDLTYAADKELPWGCYLDEQGEPRRSSLYLAAGQNILIGDYLTPKGGDLTNLEQTDTGNHLTSDGFSFGMSQICMFNRLEWSRTQPTLPDAFGEPVTNPSYESDAQPLYFRISADAPVYVYNAPALGRGGQVFGTYFDRLTLTWQGREHPSNYFINEDRNFNRRLDPGEDLDGDGVLDYGAQSLYSASEAADAGASISTLNPSGGWLRPASLKAMWNETASRRRPGAPFQVDAAMRTAHAIFACSRSNTKYGSRTFGQLWINGALIAPHIGILAAGDQRAGVRVGLQLNYDPVAARKASGYSSAHPVLTRLAQWYR